MMIRVIACVTLLAVFVSDSSLADAGILQGAAPAVLPFQMVSGDTAAVSAAPGDGVSFKVQYETSDADNTLTGLGLRMHFDSSFMAFTLPGDVLLTNKFQEQLQDDIGDLDGDPSTDKFFLTAWLDLLGNWPNVALPVDLYTAAFTLNAGLIPGESTTVRFIDSSTAASHDFLSSNVVVTAAAIPEPTTFALFLATAVCTLSYRCRRNRKCRLA